MIMDGPRCSRYHKGLSDGAAPRAFELSCLSSLLLLRPHTSAGAAGAQLSFRATARGGREDGKCDQRLGSLEEGELLPPPDSEGHRVWDWLPGVITHYAMATLPSQAL